MKKRILGAFFLTAGLFGTCSHAADAFDLEQLKQLFNTYQRQQAYDYANRYLGEMEGDSNFDYLYGVAAIDSGHASQGVFALERVLMQFPDDHVARLELARGYFILEEYARSRQEFEKVLAINPPKGVRETTESFLEQIRLREARYRTTTGGFVALGLGSDSNVLSGPDNSSLTIFQVDESDAAQSDTYSELTASWGVGHPFAPGWMATGNITASLHQNQELSAFDTTTSTVQAGVSRIYRDSRYKAEVLWQQYQLDSEKYRTMSGLNLDWQTSFSEKSRLNTTLQYVALSYPTIETKNSRLSTLALTWTQTFAGTWNPTFFASLNLGQETPDEAPNAAVERDLLGYRLGGILAFTPKLLLQTAVGIQTSDYPTTTYPFLGDISRSDDLITANVNLLWLINKDWRLDTKVGYTKNDSNVEIYSYDRTTVGLEANYSF
jgi:tetratricopeptide (TPR) repeat protein